MSAPDTVRPTITLTFEVHPALRFLLPRELRNQPGFQHVIERNASIKDVVESLGIPHTEIGTLIVDRREVGFAHQVADQESLVLQPIQQPCDVTHPTLLRPAPLPAPRFLVDQNVARLAALLRMAGFDTTYSPDWHDAELAQRSVQEHRILLTRDRALLRRACIDYGHLVCAGKPREQLKEVITFYGLHKQVTPFTRCMRCNGLLHSVPKSEILDQLKPLTRRFYEEFNQCSDCGQIYWEGTHKKGLEDILSQALEG